MMKRQRISLLALDVLLMMVATVAAALLRDDLVFSENRFAELIPYLAATAISALIVFAALGLNRTVWRFSNLTGDLAVIFAVAAAVFGALAMTFAYNRLGTVARALPILQFLVATAALIGARALHKVSHMNRHDRKAVAVLLATASGAPALTVLILGISRLTETYLQAAAELFPGRIKVAGLLGRNRRHVGRLVAAHPILGIPDDVEAVLNRLDLHGISVNRIVIASAFEDLDTGAREALLHAERCRGITLQFLADDLGFSNTNAHRTLPKRDPVPERQELRFDIAQAELALLTRRRYWRTKRLLDLIVAFVLLVLLAPVILAGALAVALSAGLPVFFWQERPGFGGRSFRLYKLRTMKFALSHDGRRLSDRERGFIFGNFLRRTRADELPQLFNILRGDMSFAGPRPLLAKDQPEAYRARLLVRPGLTGWAQVVGGREISPEDKAALDVWYVRNASFALDLEIALRTLPILLFGERISARLIERAWRDLSASGILRGGKARSRAGLHPLSPPI
jgi:lipopolysaccharide/colanic/teichoic acid biosynthesis glycosyltransferase